MPSSSPSNSLGFFNYPPEIREQVYKILLRSANHRYESAIQSLGPYYRFDLAILRVNKLIHHEATKIFHDNLFVKISTPWPEAIAHVNSEGKVAVVAMGERAKHFRNYHLRTHINTPDLTPWSAHPHESYSMVTCIQELEAFTRIWYYSNLNNMRQLNPHLTLLLKVQNPHLPNEKLPKAIQERLLLPFGQVKDLHSMQVEFFPDTSSDDSSEVKLKETVVKSQAIPAPTPEECIGSALAYKTAGNKRMEVKDYEGALEEYFKAFAAIHVIVNGRDREIHCDAYYGQELQSGPYQHQYGHYIRMMLRVQLVANAVLAYIKLQRWDDAYFWGRRSIVMFRTSMTGVDDIGGEGWEEWVQESHSMSFGAKNEMGKLFYRTALAARNDPQNVEKDEDEIDALIMAAGKYLPDDKIVRAEVEAMNLRQMVRRSKDVTA